MKNLFDGFWAAKWAIAWSILWVAIIIVPAMGRLEQLGGTFVLATNLTAFFVFLSGFAVSLLLIAKDLALAKEMPVAGQKPFFVMALLMASFALLPAFGALAFVETYPSPGVGKDYKNIAEADAAFMSATGAELVPQAVASDKKRVVLTSQLQDRAKIEQYVNELYSSLSNSRNDGAQALFILLNSAAACCISAVANLVVAALIKLASQSPEKSNIAPAFIPVRYTKR